MLRYSRLTLRIPAESVRVLVRTHHGRTNTRCVVVPWLRLFATKARTRKSRDDAEPSLEKDQDNEHVDEATPTVRGTSNAADSKTPTLELDLNAYQHQLEEEAEQIIATSPYTPKLPRCGGCGAPLQSTDEQRIGFVPKSRLNRYLSIITELQRRKMEHALSHAAIESSAPPPSYSDEIFNTISEKDKKLVCARCHSLRFHNRILSAGVSLPDWHKLLQNLRNRPPFDNQRIVVVKMLDLFDLDSTFIPNLPDILGLGTGRKIQKSLLLVANKSDVLPRDANIERVRLWVAHEAQRRYGLDFLPTKNVHLVSARTGYGMHKLAVAMETYREGGNVVVVGAANVGKSTLINRIASRALKRASQQLQAIESKKKQKHKSANEGPLTVSAVPGTTLGLIRLPLLSHKNAAKLDAGGDKTAKDKTPQPVGCLYDTPGILDPRKLAHRMRPGELRMATPSKRIVPRVIRMVAGKTLFLGGLGRLDVLSIHDPSTEGPAGKYAYFTVFCSNMLPIHLTSTPRADESYAKEVGRYPFVPPIAATSFAEKEMLQKKGKVNVKVLRQRKHPAKEAHSDPAFQPPVEPQTIPDGLKLTGRQEYELTTIGWDKSVADIVFNGIGWISVTGRAGTQIKVAAHFTQPPKEAMQQAIGNLSIHDNQFVRAVYVRESLMPFEVKVAQEKRKVIVKHGKVRTDRINQLLKERRRKAKPVKRLKNVKTTTQQPKKTMTATEQ